MVENTRWVFIPRADNGRVYKIVNTGEPYELGYPEINEGAKHLTENTGFKVMCKLPDGNWSYICSCESKENAKRFISRLGGSILETCNVKSKEINHECQKSC